MMAVATVVVAAAVEVTVMVTMAVEADVELKPPL